MSLVEEALVRTTDYTLEHEFLEGVRSKNSRNLVSPLPKWMLETRKIT